MNRVSSATAMIEKHLRAAGDSANYPHLELGRYEKPMRVVTLCLRGTVRLHYTVVHEED